MDDMNKRVELCKELVGLMPQDQAMELLDILSFAQDNDYENKEPDSFPVLFTEAWDQALTDTY